MFEMIFSVSLFAIGCWVARKMNGFALFWQSLEILGYFRGIKLQF